LLLGATGLVGGECLRLLQKNDNFERIVVLTRGPLDYALLGPKVEHHIIDAVDVDVFIHHHDHLGPGHLAGAPDGAHDLAGVVGVILLDLDEGAGVEDAEHREVVIEDVGDEDFQEGEEETLGGLAEVIVFLRRFADDGGGVDGVAAMGDGGDVEDGELAGERVKAGVVSEWPFGAQLVESAGLPVDCDRRV